MALVKPYQKKTNLGSYPYLTVVLSISLALFVIGLFGLVVIHASSLSEVIRENIEIQAYLQRSVTDEEQKALHKVLSTKKYIDVKHGEPQLEFISKNDAAKKFIAETGENFVEFLGQNPLRDAFELRIKPEYANPEQMRAIKKDLETHKEIFEVEYVESLVSELNSNIQKISIIMLTFALVLLATVTFLINNTIKLAFFSQRFLIRSMQLVGATPWFIQRPFVLRAAWQGLISGVIACTLLWAVLQYANSQIPEIKLLQSPQEIFILLFVILVLGSIIGFVSAFSSVSKYLKMSLDELH